MRQYASNYVRFGLTFLVIAMKKRQNMHFNFSVCVYKKKNFDANICRYLICMWSEIVTKKTAILTKEQRREYIPHNLSNIGEWIPNAIMNAII